MINKESFMIARRNANERGHANFGWLNSHHSFSFGSYHDPQHMGWGDLRVINDDIVAPGQGFGKHGHRDMAIISYVLEGALAHTDSIGNGSVLHPGQVQLMNAGTGVMHSEFNPSVSDPVHFLQIWVMPAANGTAPSYQETAFTDTQKRGKLCLLASPNGQDQSLTIGQDVKLFASLLDGNERINYAFESGRLGYVHVARGSIEINGEQYHAGDAAKISGADVVLLANGQNAEILLFDLIA
jgi:redox-sensitive bicupin YhaK (pirin superfamily)